MDGKGIIPKILISSNINDFDRFIFLTQLPGSINAGKAFQVNVQKNNIKGNRGS